jgi:methionyl-tRNA formyltransferase
MRIVFFGTPAFAVPSLSEIVGQGHDVAAVYTQPPRAAGRGMAERKSPVHETAERLGIPVFTPHSLRSPEEAERFAALEPEAGVVVAYGQILPRAFLDTPPNGCLNLHGSLLPRWRGAAPIQRAVMAGDAETGVMVMRMEAGFDTGPVAMSERVPIATDVTAGELSDRLAALGADLMVRALGALSRGGLTFVPQSGEGVTYAKKIEKTETRVDWSRPASEVHNHIRGLAPEPGAWFDLAGDRVKVLRSTLAPGTGAPGTVLDANLTIACGDGAVRLVTLQRAGKGALPAADFLRGNKVPAGSVLA